MARAPESMRVTKRRRSVGEFERLGGAGGQAFAVVERAGVRPQANCPERDGRGSARVRRVAWWALQGPMRMERSVPALLLPKNRSINENILISDQQ